MLLGCTCHVFWSSVPVKYRTHQRSVCVSVSWPRHCRSTWCTAHWVVSSVLNFSYGIHWVRFALWGRGGVINCSSPDLFSLESENVIRPVIDNPGINMGGYNLNSLHYADDTVVISENEKDLQGVLHVVVTESEKKGLSLNIKKMETVVVSSL